MVCIDQPAREAFAQSLKRPLPWNRKIASLADVTAAVHVVYHTTAVLAAKMQDRDKIWSDVALLLDDVGDTIWQYFNGEPNTALTETSYDAFCARLCGDFVINYNHLATGAAIPGIEIGVAQKLVNTVFVYLSCYDDYMTYADLFAYCHMPIDTYMLNFLAYNVEGGGFNVHYAHNMVAPNAYYNCPVCRGRRKKWEALGPCCYKSILTRYRAKLRKLFPDCTPLHLYFYIRDLAKKKQPWLVDEPIHVNPSAPLPGTKTAFHK